MVKRSNAGFTLVELLLVVSMISILAMVALVLALVAILLVLLMSRRKDGESTTGPIEVEDPMMKPLVEDVLIDEPEPLPSPMPEEPLQRPRTH